MNIEIELYRDETQKHSHRYKINIKNYEKADAEELELLKTIDINLADWLYDVETEENKKQELPFN